MVGDVPVGDVGAAVHPHGADPRVAGWYLEPLIGDQHGLDPQSFGRAKHQVLHLSWCRVRIDPDLQVSLGARVGRPDDPASAAARGSCWSFLRYPSRRALRTNTA